MAPDLVTANGVVLAVQTFGDPADPAVLLIAGTAASMVAWADDLCAGLAAGGRYVVRYDHRDTGRSVSYPVGSPGYDLADLVRDVVGLLDVLGLPRAHLVGSSLGGMIAQLVALDHPARVASLTLVSTSPAPPDGAEADLPPPSLRVRVELDDVDLPDWSDRDSVVGYLVELARIRAGTGRAFDEPAARVLAGRTVEHGADLAASVVNHGLLGYGGSWRGRLAEVRVPTLVVHGAADPLLPLAHARALAGEIRDAELLVLDGAGHDLAPADRATVLPALLRHTGAAGRVPTRR